MTTIIPYFDPLLGKLRNSDIALVSLASISDPFIVNNLQVLSNASITTLHTNSVYASSISAGIVTSNNIAVSSNASINLIHANSILASTATIGAETLSYQYWNIATASLGPQEGLSHWDSAHGNLQIGLAGGNVDVAVGMSNQFPRRVKNLTGATLTKGTAVYINGNSGNIPTVTKAIATGDATSAFTLGLLSEDIPNNNVGWVTTFGAISGINLSSFTGGDTLYLSGATAGYYTNIPTRSPYHYVRLGTVVRATTDGELVVNVINGFETDELHDVVISSLASGQILISGPSSLWYNKSLTSVLPPSVSALASLTDVALTSLATNNYLQYNGAVWTNADIFFNIDGGSAISNYLVTQNINGGNA